MNVEDQDRKRKSISKVELGQVLDDIEYHSVDVGDKWFVLSLKWWKQVENALDGGSTEDIPPINNSDIVNSPEGKEPYTLAPRLLEKRDFLTVPETAYKVLVDSFGLDNEQRDVIERLVINDKRSGNIIEVYPKEFTVILASDQTKRVKIRSRNDSIGALRKKTLEAFVVDTSPERIRFFVKHRNAIELMTDLTDDDDSSTFFLPEHPIILDILDENGQGSIKSWHGMDIPETAQFTKGACGLVNLGHTCYMSSGLQCISNIPELTNYFLSDDYLADVNEANPLGSKGKLARAYADLIKSMWSGKYESVMPRYFKTVMGKCSRRFSGFAREDAQELLACLLDVLHEDLNRVKTKPYVEERDFSEGMSQKEIAEEAWTNYKKRNDSIVIDNLHGQLRNTLVCPKCSKVSIKFDPFCFLSVPVPVQDERVSLVDCIKLFTKEEQLSEMDSWYCPRCRDHVRATKKLDLWKLPRILIVHLKRFQTTRWTREKIQTPVDIPVWGCNLRDIIANMDHEDAIYDLTAVSHHSRGGLADGHYNATAINGETWYYFNDALVTETDPPVPDDSPYLLAVSLICEMELQLVLDPIFLFPVPCVVRDEPLVNLPGRTSLHYVALFVLLVIAIPLFFACFVYRHQAVMVPGSRWALSPTKQTTIPLLYALILFGIPPINYYAMQPPGSIEQYTKFLSPDWPPAVLDRTDCLYPDRFLFMCILSVICIIIFFVLAVTIVAHTFATLRNHATMSDKMREYHRTMTKVLVLQSGVPVVFAQQPLFFMILTYFLNWNGHLIVPICLTISSSHSFLHSIAVLATTPVYRKYCATILFRKKSSIQPTPLSQFSTKFSTSH
ncbi:hypothetical protein PRIPAC_82836 [Pristionchus pacificus]|uniref:ubiquitinyl hydrolase 1 n=1 Tax=Pristionchus pacificus TaxID=54126 RepID=A0A2A6CMA1_PRIPA|nr:hypothetical protein PRIPAC_82836 [Pristionchus pacificus]|eukprot:PDM79375.1 G protein-coupled receptor [Pristionchus pacificus]